MITGEANAEIARIQRYIDQGLVGRFHLQKELDFIESHQRTTVQMHDAGYISGHECGAELMMLAARLAVVKQMDMEMFERYDGIYGKME
jgi:hypothetical protein